MIRDPGQPAHAPVARRGIVIGIGDIPGGCCREAARQHTAQRVMGIIAHHSPRITLPGDETARIAHIICNAAIGASFADHFAPAIMRIGSGVRTRVCDRREVIRPVIRISDLRRQGISYRQQPVQRIKRKAVKLAARVQRADAVIRLVIAMRGGLPGRAQFAQQAPSSSNTWLCVAVSAFAADRTSVLVRLPIAS